MLRLFFSGRNYRSRTARRCKQRLYWDLFYCTVSWTLVLRVAPAVAFTTTV